MPADDQQKTAGEGRKSFAGLSGEEVRQRAEAAAQQARARSEFILSRAYGLLRDPKGEWEQIRAEETNTLSILMGYVAPLAAFFAVCVLLGSLVFEHPPLIPAFLSAVLTFFLLTGFVWLVGFVIAGTAEYFDSDRDDLAAQKVAAYSFTPFFLSGVLWLWPTPFLIALSFVMMALSAFLLDRGLPPLMKTPVDRATAFAATVCIVALVAFIVAFALASCVTGMGRF